MSNRSSEGGALSEAKTLPSSGEGSGGASSPLPSLPPVASKRRRRSSPYASAPPYTKEERQLIPVEGGGYPPAQFIEPLKRLMTKGSKPHRIVEAAIALGIDHDRSEIAKQLGISDRTLRQYIYEARKAGLVGSLADPAAEIEFGIVPKAVRNLDAMLDAGDAELKERATMKVLDNTVFKPVVGNAAPSMGLQINIVQPEGAPLAIREGTIKGTANFLEGETDGD